MTPSLETLLGARVRHAVIDMQRLFAEDTPWHTRALHTIVPRVETIARHAPQHTVLTRFVTPETPAAAAGAWQGYYRRWRDLTLERMDRSLLDVVAPLAALAPPARVCDKTTHSAFNSGDFAEVLRTERVETLVLTGVETDVCVLGTALDAIDIGYHVVVVEDAVASSDEPSHRATLEHTLRRFDQQIVVASTAEVLELWVPG